VDKDRIHLLESGTVGIGMLQELPFIRKGELRIHKDAVLVLFTDGVVELENESGEEYGNERLSKVVREKLQQIEHVDDLISHIISSMDRHRGSQLYFDDTALLCCRFR
jgi:sigma-B regulation protein RsbU (phosphoserine phosphatase)